jgi:hypothetical protein
VRPALQEMLEARKASDEANKANAAQNNAHLGLAPLMLTQGPGHPGGPAGVMSLCCRLRLHADCVCLLLL